MTGFLELPLVRFLDFYLVLLFLASVIRRFDLYRSVIGLVRHVPGRWPRLFELVKKHRTIFLTWQTLLPALLTLGLLVVQLTASRLIWPNAAQPPHGLTLGKLLSQVWAAAVAISLGVAMFAVDVYFIVVVGRVDRRLLESYFDQAEFWLRSKAAHVVRFFTFGFINPRRMVTEEVQKALIDVSRQLNVSLWWIVLQLTLRISFGLSIWLTWAFSLRLLPSPVL